MTPNFRPAPELVRHHFWTLIACGRLLADRQHVHYIYSRQRSAAETGVPGESRMSMLCVFAQTWLMRRSLQQCMLHLALVSGMSINHESDPGCRHPAAPKHSAADELVALAPFIARQPMPQTQSRTPPSPRPDEPSPARVLAMLSAAPADDTNQSDRAGVAAAAPPARRRSLRFPAPILCPLDRTRRRAQLVNICTTTPIFPERKRW